MVCRVAAAIGLYVGGLGFCSGERNFKSDIEHFRFSTDDRQLPDDEAQRLGGRSI